jgi:cell division protein FtsA
MEHKIMVGLDVGNSKIKAVVGRLNEDNDLIIMGFGESKTDNNVVKGMVRNVTKTTEAITEAIKVASQLSEVGIGEVITNISNQNISGQIVNGSYIIEHNQQNMKKTRATLGNSLIHVCPQDFSVDDIWKDVHNPVGMSGSKLDGKFLNITGSTLAIESVDKCFKDIPTKTEIKEKLLSSLASGLSTLTDDEKLAGVALVDIGAGNTDIVIYQDNKVRFVTTLPIGGNDVTHDIQQGCGILPDIAEKLKVRFGAAISNEVDPTEIISVPGIGVKSSKEICNKNIAIIIEERLKEILSLIQIEIKRSGFENKLDAGLVFTGGSVQMPYFEELASIVMGYETRIGLPNLHVSKNGGEIGNDPSYATAIGLLWKGFKSYDSRKDEIVKIKTQSSSKNMNTTGTLFDTPVEKNFWKKGINFLKNKLKDDFNETDDKF